VRNVPISEVDDLDRAVVAIGTDYPPEHVLPAHRHRRAQFLYAATGLMRVETSDGSWTIPTRRAVLIPPSTEHMVVMQHVSTRSLYLEPAAVPWFPERCQAVDVSPLLRELLLEAVDIPPLYAGGGRDGILIELILREISRSTALPLDLPLPSNSDLRRRCQAFLGHPNVHETAAQWADELHISARTLARRFRSGTGTTFAGWRERACVVHSLTLLDDGVPIAQIAGALGYESPAAFATMFRRVLGSAPTAYRGSRTADRADGRRL
jgi:AraC-like DNA-binding protein/mannose-6-phosphate isomerase-like protein (cupin superfamily)